jgi:hypothetical protein
MVRTHLAPLYATAGGDLVEVAALAQLDTALAQLEAPIQSAIGSSAVQLMVNKLGSAS